MAYSDTKQRLQITFGKFGALKYTSNLDIAKVWERVLRRAELPILYSQGFNTRPRIQLATALPLGFTSECEILDVSLREMITLENLAERLLAVAPSGLTISAIKEVPLNAPALQPLVHSSEYRIRFDEPLAHDLLQGRVDQLLDTEKLIRTEVGHGKKSVYDLRPLIIQLQVDEQGNLIAHLITGSHGNFRPDDLLQELGLADYPASIHRFRLHLVK